MRRKSQTTKTSANPIWATEERRHGAVYQPSPGRHCDGRDLCLHGARSRDDLPGDRPSEFRAGRNGDVLDLHFLAADAVGNSLLVGLPDHAGLLLCGGIVIERLLFKPLAKATILTNVAGFIALYGIINSFAGLIWDFTIKQYPTPFGSAPFLGSQLI